MGERIEDRRERLDADDPGAPPGYLLDPHDDELTGSHNWNDGTGCAEEVSPDLWDEDGDPLARGGGEEG